MHTSPGRIRSSQKQGLYGHVHFSTSASCHETHDTVYSEAKLNSKGEYDAIPPYGGSGTMG